MNGLQLLSRNEMKMIKGGNDECTETNCIACPTYNECATPSGGGSLPNNCSWGICEECCDGVGQGG